MKSITRIVLTIALAAGVIAGLIGLGAWLRDGLRDRHALTVSQIECEPPPGMARDVFLQEVHYYGRLPETLNALDADLPARLTEAFGKHPRVVNVRGVVVEAPNRVRVECEYR